MSIEKQVKNQARAALRGNMSRLIAAAGVVVTGFLLFEYIEYLVLAAYGFLDAQAEDILTSRSNIPFFCTQTAVLVFGLLISPLFNGFLKMAANAAVKKDCSSADVVFFFRNGLYFKTVIINMLVMLLFLTVSSALDISAYCRTLFPQLFEQALTLNPYTLFHQDAETNAAMFGAALIDLASVIIKLMVYMIFVHYQLLGYALDETRGIGRCVFVTLRFSFKHFGKLLKLMLSFAGWFALCFFVVPALYAVPYFAVASLMSARWLLELENTGGAV